MDDIYKEYKEHPRIIEVRFIILYNIITREFGMIATDKIFDSICEAFDIDKRIIKEVINKKYDIQRKSKIVRKQWRQEVFFMAKCYGLSRNFICSNILNISSSNMYKFNDEYDPDIFVTKEWLDKLDNDFFLLGNKIYRTQVIRFMEIMDSMFNCLKKWGGSK